MKINISNVASVVILGVFGTLVACSSSSSGANSGGDSGSKMEGSTEQCPTSAEPVGACSVEGQSCGPYFGCATCTCDQSLWNCSAGSCDAGAPDGAQGDAMGSATDALQDSPSDAEQCPTSAEPVGACSVEGQSCGPYFGCATCICDQALWNCSAGSCDAAGGG
jgi:hypothetical protein